MTDMLAFDALVSSAQTGDLLFSHGTGFGSRLMEIGMGTTFSHVSLIMRDVPEDILDLYDCPGDGAGVYVLDAHRMVKGVRMLPLREWVDVMRQHHGPKFFFAYRPVFNRDPKIPFRCLSNYPRACAVIRAAASQKFNGNFASIVKSYTHRYKDQSMRENVDCAELAAKVFIAMGLFYENEIPRNFITSSFTNAAALQKRMPFSYYVSPSLFYVR